MHRTRSTLATLTLAAMMLIAALPANAGRKPPGRNPPMPAPAAEPAPMNLNPLAAFWAQWAAYWAN